MSKGTSGGGAGSGGGSATVTGSDTFGPSKAKVTHIDYTKAEAEKAIKDTMGRNATLQDVASAVGATDKSTVNISIMSDGISVRVSGDGYNAHRVIYRDSQNKLTAENIFFETDKTGTGIGTRVFGRQVEQSRKMGFDRIETYAAGPGGGFNGYYTWARFGYDAKIPTEVAGKLPTRFKNAKNISDLMRSEGGAKWWKRNGQGAKMQFDLKRGSLSSKALEKYLKKKGIKKDD